MNRRDILAGVAGAAVIGMVPIGALAQSPSPAVAAGGAPIEEAKLPALMGGDFATVTSQLALQKASHPAVKQFAALEVAEQAATAMAFGAKPGMAGLKPDHAAMVEKLQAAEGTAFDAMYIDGQIKGHRELLKIHKSYARNGQDPMACGASIVGVTGIETHLVMLQSIRQALA
jgi:putative membrane protein